MSAYVEALAAKMKAPYEIVQELEGLTELSSSQQGDYDQAVKTLTEIKAEYDKAVERSQKGATVSEMVAGLRGAQRGQQAQPRVPNDNPPGLERKALSASVLDSFEFKTNGEMRSGDTFALPKDFLQRIVESKAAWVPTGLSAAGGPIQVFGPNTPQAPMPLLRLIPTTPWGNFAVPYLAPVFTNNAAVVPMAQDKPESTNAGNVASQLMQTIATRKLVPRQLLRYIPGVRQVLDDELIGAVESELSDELINGDGTTGHFMGLLNWVGVLSAAGTTLTDQILNGIGQIATQGGAADGILMNPSDYWALVALGYSNNSFAPIVSNGRFAGIPVAADARIAATKAVVADWSRAMRLYDGESANVRAVDYNSGTSNVIQLIGELDAAFVIGKPNYVAKASAPLVAP